MKKLLTFAAVLAANISVAQTTDLPKISGDTLYTTSGFKVVKGDELKIGTGTMPDASFKFIRTNSASFFNYSATNQARANEANSLPRSTSGQKLKVIRVEARGNKKRGFNYFAVLGGMIRYEVDVENAIPAGEIVVPNEFKPKTLAGNNVIQASPADELKKFKGLLEDGTITQEEFNAKKKQLLGL